jgi:hypothetical protein
MKKRTLSSTLNSAKAFWPEMKKSNQPKLRKNFLLSFYTARIKNKTLSSACTQPKSRKEPTASSNCD